MKAYKESGVTAVLILKLYTRWSGVVSHILRSLYCQVNSVYMTKLYFARTKNFLYFIAPLALHIFHDAFLKATVM
jgi:hypothetical protein